MSAATIEHWLEWKRECALGKCDPETQAALTGFLWPRWQKYLGKEGGAVSPERGELTPAEAWHLLETNTVAGRHGHGKRYKQWIFLRLETHAGHPLDIVESGVTLRVRDAVREYLRGEGRARGCGGRDLAPSLDEPAGGATAVARVDQWLAPQLDVSDEAALREYVRLGEEEAGALWPTLPRRARVVLAATGLGVPLSHPRVEQLAERKHSSLSELRHVLARTVAQAIERKYAADEPACRQALRVATMRALEKLSSTPNPPETWQAELFLLAG